MRKKKQLAAFMLLTAMLLNLTACVKTPEENIVTDKSKGLSEENIIPKEKDGKEKQLNIRKRQSREKMDSLLWRQMMIFPLEIYIIHRYTHIRYGKWIGRYWKICAAILQKAHLCMKIRG